MDAYNLSFYFTESNIWSRGAFSSFSNDTKQKLATFPTQNPVSLPYLYLNQCHSPQAFNTSLVFSFPKDDIPVFDTGFYFSA